MRAPGPQGKESESSLRGPLPHTDPLLDFDMQTQPEITALLLPSGVWGCYSFLKASETLVSPSNRRRGGQAWGFPASQGPGFLATSLTAHGSFSSDGNHIVSGIYFQVSKTRQIIEQS